MQACAINQPAEQLTLEGLSGGMEQRGGRSLWPNTWLVLGQLVEAFVGIRDCIYCAIWIVPSQLGR